MPFPASTSTKLTLDGVTYASVYSDQGNRFEGASVTVPPAKKGAVSGKDEIQFDPGHGFAAADKIDVFWTGGSYRKATIAALTGDTATLTLTGAGDPFPSDDGTPVTAMKTDAVIVPVVINGTEAVAIGAFGEAQGFVTFLHVTGPGIDYTLPIRTANDGPSWTKDSGVFNPLDGTDVKAISFTHGSATGPKTMRAGVGLN